MTTKSQANAGRKRVWVPGAVIVGAGPSGLATAACLKQKGVPSLVLEKEHCIASSWKLRTYERLRLHLPKHLCELPFMAFPSDFPTYPTRQQFIEYVEAYTERFRIRPLFGAEVRRAEYDRSISSWRVQAAATITEADMPEFVCRWLVVATGENSEAAMPEFAGLSGFRGRVLHTSTYKNGDHFAGEKVLVVGCGNSGMEVCLDLCDNRARPSLVVRNKLHILPREMLGVSTFGMSMWLLKWLPMRVVDWVLLLCSWVLLGGSTERYGLRRPKMGPLQLKYAAGKTPVLDVGTLAMIKTGHISVVPGISRFTEKGVEFVNGEHQAFDSVVLATGYRSNVPTWLKEAELLREEDGFPESSWKGKNGIYAIGFTRRGLLGAAIDAKRITQDIVAQFITTT